MSKYKVYTSLYPDDKLYLGMDGEDLIVEAETIESALQQATAWVYRTTRYSKSSTTEWLSVNKLYAELVA